MKKQTYDLEERLLEYSVRIIKIVEQVSNTRAGNHVAGQLLRSGTSPYPNHGEAQAAESPKDFIHKLRISLKELRETQRWLKLIQRVPLIKKPELLNDILDIRFSFDVRCSTFDVHLWGPAPTGHCRIHWGEFFRHSNLLFIREQLAVINANC